jgi:hypothetical protein
MKRPCVAAVRPPLARPADDRLHWTALCVSRRLTPRAFTKEFITSTVARLDPELRDKQFRGSALTAGHGASRCPTTIP